MTIQEEVDAKRLEEGWQAFCPVCRRPVTTGPVAPVQAARRLAHHLVSDHDPMIAALLEIHLRLAEPKRADPFYPVGTEW